MVSKTQLIGQHAEQQACHYLLKKGLTLIESNFRCKMGEIDLIMRDGELLVFTEVKARQSNAFIGGLESVDYRKQQRLLRASTYYLQHKRLTDKYACRFDIVVVTINSAPPKIEWTKDAFRP